MRVRILLFGQLKDIIGRTEDSLDLESGARISEVMGHYARTFPGFEGIAPSIACAVNQEYASTSTVLREGDEVGLLPPVSGGSPQPAQHRRSPGTPQETYPPQPRAAVPHEQSDAGITQEQSASKAAIVREPIDVQSLVESVKARQDGAVVVFDGIVRDNSRGRRTLYLDYEAYESMALSEMQRLSSAALERFAVREVRVVHRLGRLAIGETSVLIVVASAHRAAAFEACRWLIDTLKKTVPIWKKEYFEDGAVWADGEPFPEEIHRNK